MDTARQVLRWAIPGWHLWLFALLFIVDRLVFSAKILTLTEFASRNFSGLLSLFTILAGLGVPTGFVIYQIYFWIYWSLPLPVKSPEDRGYSILKDSREDWKQHVGYDLDKSAHRTQGKTVVKLGPLALTFKTRQLLKRYQHNWLLADFAWYRLILLNDAEWLDGRATVLADIYHSLGASLVSLWLGYGAYLVYDVLAHHELILNGDSVFLWSALLNLVPLITLTFVLRFNRADTLRTLEALKHDFITYFERFPRNPSS